MSVKPIHDDGQTLKVPAGKVLCVVDTRAALDKVASALESAGFNKIRSLSGEEGLHILERVHTFFFSDAEEPVLHRHIEELKAGHIVIGIEVSSDRVDQAVSIASANGARFIVHFGVLAVTWLKK